MTRAQAVWLFALLLAGACQKSETTSGPPGAGSTAAATAIAPPAHPAASAQPGASASAGGYAAASPAAWSGSYEAAAGALYIPPDWKNVRWTGADSGAGLGTGTLSLAIDAASGRVAGTVEGPLGPAVVDGYAREGKLTAALVRKNPEDRGFTGTLVGAIDGEHATGTISASTAEASAIRTASFTLAPSGR